ncbi:hypothetical protein CTheo_7134 [Ceratobasidium theobromae]|uniref:Uncharacterized protein n=1 Tax=Ceratobasidium theobromae TaxID=1582974 RepID=A0A5N5QD18_9AGAM|nr:hypothetical protein CTheo_7134 [Ceratobasidium theobromae]
MVRKLEIAESSLIRQSQDLTRSSSRFDAAAGIPPLPATPPPPVAPATPPAPVAHSTTRPTPTFSQAARCPGQRSAPSARLLKPPAQSPPPPKPVRVVVHIDGQSLPSITNTSNTTLFRSLSAVIPSPLLLGVHRLGSGNLVLPFQPETAHSVNTPLFATIRTALGADGGTRVSFDVPWSRLHLAQIPARESPDAPVFSQEDLRASLEQNPLIAGLRIT